MQPRKEASKAAEADAVKARSLLRQERIDWEKADAESRIALHSLKEEWRMLQDTNAQLHANVTRLTNALEVSVHSCPLHTSCCVLCPICKHCSVNKVASNCSWPYGCGVATRASSFLVCPAIVAWHTMCMTHKAPVYSQSAGHQQICRLFVSASC